MTEPAQINESLSIDKPKGKPGPKAKPKVDVVAMDEQLRVQGQLIIDLTALVVEMGTHTGQANIIRKHKFPAYQHVHKNKYG